MQRDNRDRRHRLGRCKRKVFSGLVKSMPAAVIFGICAISASGQIRDFGAPAPPPVRIFSKSERSQLESQTDPKRRLATAISLMEARVKKAEELKSAENYDAMYIELGGFHGLMDEALRFLSDENRRSGKALSYLKKFEMSLRTFSPRLEIIRRDLPDRYDPYLRSLIRYVRDARSKAIEPFFTDSVVPNRS